MAEKITPNEALGALVAFAMERHGSKPGFDGFGVFIRNNVIEMRLPRYCSLSSTPQSFAMDVVTSIRDSGDSLVLLGLGLDLASKDEDAHARILAERILAFMASAAQGGGPRFPKPMHFVSVTEEGIAILIVVTDEMWALR